MNAKGLDQPVRSTEDSRLGTPPANTAGILDRGEDQFRVLVEGFKDYAIFMLDPEGHVVTWNKGAQRIKGYTAQEIIGQHFSRFYPQEDIERGKPKQGLAVASAEGRFEAEGWRVRKDGSRFMANVVITALRDDAGRLRGFAKVTRDITERKQAEQALLEAESHRRAVWQSSLDAILVMDEQGNLTDFNPAAEKMFGYRRAEVLGQPLADKIIPPALREAHRRGLARFLATGQGRLLGKRVELQAMRANGTEFPVELTVVTVANASQPLFIGTVRDITERKQAEESLRRAKFTLQSIFDAAPVAVLSFDLEGRITHWSRGAERMFGWTAAEALDQICPTVPSDGLEDFHAMVARAVRDGPETGLVRYRQKKSGERIHASLCPAPLRDAEGRTVGVMVILEDVTDRVRAQQTLEQHSKRLVRLSRQLIHAQEDERRRIARELHDQVGQALTLLQIGLQATQELTDAPAMAHELGDHIEATAQILDQVRNLSLDLRPSLLDDLGLVPALRWYTDRVGHSARMEIRFETALVDGRLPAEIETACFRTAQEALTNVLRHSQACTARVELVQEAGDLVLTVRDDGCGFDPEEARQRASSGGSMGLLAMEERVTAMGGSLALESSPGHGTRVRATFPLPKAP